MIKTLKKTYYAIGAAMTAGMMFTPGDAFATSSSGNTFSSIAENLQESIKDMPGLLTGLSYMIGLMLGVLGVMKLKDHVENPGNTPLKDGAIRLAAGGALFALPIVYEAMFETVGSGGAGVSTANLNEIEFAVGGN